MTTVVLDEKSHHNYITVIRNNLMKLLPDCGYDLIGHYTLLALTRGTATTLENVHDAWSVWMAAHNPDHRSLVPFNELTSEVQELDRKYMEAIRAVSPVRSRHCKSAE